jgi:8-oxo-dGTP pyrophosphatase MutT (NUDIX family)
MDDTPFYLILLTYKGKALVMQKVDSPLEEGAQWCFIGGGKRGRESSVQALERIVEEETGIKIKGIERVNENFFQARLSDQNVNEIKRQEGQLLDFFTLPDLYKLDLETNSKSFSSQVVSLV